MANFFSNTLFTNFTNTRGHKQRWQQRWKTGLVMTTLAALLAGLCLPAPSTSAMKLPRSRSTTTPHTEKPLLSHGPVPGAASPLPGHAHSAYPTLPPAANVPKDVVKGGATVDADTLRVGISNDGMEDYEYFSTQLSATSRYTLLNNTVPILTGNPEQVVAITVSSTGFKIITNGQTVGTFTGPIRLIPEAGGLGSIPSIRRRKRVPQYKGVLEVTRGYSSPAKLSVVNILPLQEYLKAVVPNELPPRYGYEAVKAQSVAARNYAIRPREKSFPQFDICDSQFCQVYFGAQTEHPTSNRALFETHGLVALYDGRPILALYSSAHGGYSEHYENSFSDTGDGVFPGTPVPYLRGKPDVASAAAPYGDLTIEENARRFWTSNVNDYDGKSSYHRWQKEWPVHTLMGDLTTQWQKLLTKKNTAAFLSGPYNSAQPPNRINMGQLKRITVTQRGVSGKAMTITLDTTTGTWQVQKEFVIRNLFRHGGRMLPSANVVFSHLTDPAGRIVTIRANGGGFGHGIGMSQLGASTLSDRAKKFDAILQHYYTGVSIGSIPVHVGPLPENSSRITHPQRVTFVAPRTSYTPKLIVRHSAPLTQSPTVHINDNPIAITVANQASTKPYAASSTTTPTPNTPATDDEGLLSELASLIKRLNNSTPTPAPAATTTTPKPGSAADLPFQTTVTLPSNQLKIGQLNTLTLYPLADPTDTTRISAWIELIPTR